MWMGKTIVRYMYEGPVQDFFHLVFVCVRKVSEKACVGSYSIDAVFD